MNSKIRCLCPLCKSKSIFFVGNIQYYLPVRFSSHEINLNQAPEIWGCGQCASWFSQNILPEEKALELYQQGNAADRWSQSSLEKRQVSITLDELFKHFKINMNVLDVGCNTGELLDFAKLQGCITAGVEYSNASRNIIEEKGHTSYQSIKEVKSKFNIITAFDLVEHLYDVPIFLQQCRERLFDGGILLILTGDIGSVSARICKEKWWYLKYPEHIVFPSRTFFENIPGLQLEDWVATFASSQYKKSFFQMVWGSMRRMVNRDYTGLPSMGPDHALIILRK